MPSKTSARAGKLSPAMVKLIVFHRCAEAQETFWPEYQRLEESLDLPPGGLEEVELRRHSHYDQRKNELVLDMGAGRVLKVDFAREGVVTTIELQPQERKVAGPFGIEGMEEKVYQVGITHAMATLPGVLGVDQEVLEYRFPSVFE